MAKRTSVAIFAIAGATAIGSCDKRPASDTSTGARTEEACATEPAAKIRTVLHYLHRMHEHEIRSGNLAADRTLVPDVRKLAKRMVTEHMTADMKLVDLARHERIDLSTIAPADPVHAAALRLATADEEEMQELSTEALDVVYVSGEAERHGFLLEVVDQGEKVASGEVKSLLDEAHDMAARHHDSAVMLMQDLHFVPHAVGGGPAGDDDTDTSTDPVRNRLRRDSRPTRREDPMRLDGGVWPPSTTPPERMP
jgi:predicted outer membrane protein